MKKIITILNLFIITTCFSQNDKIYLKIDDINKVFIEKKFDVSFVNYSIIIKNSKSGDIDSYNFIANLDSNKSLIENGLDFNMEGKKIIINSDLNKVSPCKVHDMFSSKRVFFIYEDRETKKTKQWMFMYTGTSRNLIITKNGKL